MNAIANTSPRAHHPLPPP